MIINYKNTYFFTATILEWKKLLLNDTYKDFLVDSMRFLVNEKRVKIYGFALMPNHIHIIWHLIDDLENRLAQSSLLRFTANKMKKDLEHNNPKLLEQFKVDAKDRMHQFWERNPLSYPIYTDAMLIQKLNYIHQNPCEEKWKLADVPENYYYCSAKFYDKGVDDFGFITSYVWD